MAQICCEHGPRWHDLPERRCSRCEDAHVLDTGED